MSVNPVDLIKEWWNLYQADPRAKYDDIVSGMRQEVDTSGTIVYKGGVSHDIVKSQQQTGSCQYWIKGLPAVCSYWDSSINKCNFEGDVLPTGYGIGLCDMLGRREWCSEYIKSTSDDLSEFVCVAPCIERSGLGKQIKSEVGSLIYRPFFPSEIKGYNPDESTGVGRCDGWGMGRGNQQEVFSTLEEIYIFPPMCRQYRPQQMGFGAIQPRPYHGSTVPGKPFDPKVNWIPETLRELHDGSPADPLEVMPIILPFIFQVYNLRAKFQKCSHWDNDNPAFFKIGDYGSDPLNYNIEMDDVSRCVCEETELCDPFRLITEEWVENLPWVLRDVWAPYGGVVCNGSKPECPCYTGKWNYCIDNLMRDGMRITSDQILELRFWSFPFPTKKDYDDFYRAKPGPTQNGYADETTSDIYTFTKWIRDEESTDTSPNESQMEGYRSSLCVPAPLHMREFTRDVYVSNDPVTYPRINEYDGSNIDSEGVLFPTLVRALMDPNDFVVPIFVAYPYDTIDPWEETYCDESDKPEYCIHDTNMLFSHTSGNDEFVKNLGNGDNVSVIGHCLPNKEVYVINSTISRIINYIEMYPNPTSIPKNLWRKVNDDIFIRIRDMIESAQEGITVGETNDRGVFTIRNVDLNVNKHNTLYVICKYNHSDFPEYTYKKINVLSRYWAVTIFQESANMNRSGDIFTNNFPSWFDYGVSINGSVNSTVGYVSKVFSVYAYYQYGIAQDTSYYAYCINEYSKTCFVEKWTQVGNSGYIWAEVDDINISYLWSFEVTIARIYFVMSDEDRNDNTKNKNVCGNNDIGYIELEVLFPNYEDNSDSYKNFRKSVPPNSVLLKSEKPMGFFNSEWELYLEYKYEVLEDSKPPVESGAEIVWPENVDSDFSPNKIVISPYYIEYNNGKFIINNFGTVRNRGSIKVMAYASDEYGRVQTAGATKLVVQGCILNCRSVDIFYNYKADAAGFSLEPSSGFFTWRGAPSSLPSENGYVHHKAAICGDHDCGEPCIGPMWFPFNDCGTMDFYNVLNGAAQCTMPVFECEANSKLMGPGGWRYCAAAEYECWVTPGGNWASVCGTSFYYHYSHATMASLQFSGKAKKKGMVDEALYKYYGWSLPPFGNKGRAQVERFLTREFTSFWDFSSYPPQVRAEFMPMVFDYEDLYYDPNCFSQIDTLSPLREPFVHIPILSNYTASFVNEKIEESTRYTFDEILEVIYHGNCMYPFPYLSGSVARYGFKMNDVVWAWPEFWNDIERGLDNSLLFVDFFRPAYYYDIYKKEHRLITSEGEKVVKYIGPKSGVEPATASISVGGGPERFFNIVYDDYDSEKNVDWNDESSVGDGSDNENMYELANNGKGQNRSEGGNIVWFHSFDTLFDDDASSDPNEDRKITFPDFDAYYNRGVIANIPISKLIYLPIDISSIDGSATIEHIDSVIISFDVGSSVEGTDIAAVVGIKIEGIWGIVTTDGGDIENLSIPIVQAFEHDTNIENIDDEIFDSIYEDKERVFRHNKSGREGLYLFGRENQSENYNIDMSLHRSPKRFITKNGFFFIRLKAISGEKISFNSISIDVGQYKDEVEEIIYVWEKKFHISRADLGNAMNADGIESDKLRTYDLNLKNAGQYFPHSSSYVEGSGEILSKTNMVGFSEFYSVGDDEEVPVTIGGLKSIEKELQQELYEEAFELDNYDELAFGGVLSPVFSQISKKMLCNMGSPYLLNIKFEKIKWENNDINDKLRQEGDIIQSGGHFFKWSDTFTRDRCYIFGPVQSIYSVKFVHHKHGKEESTLDAGHSYRGWGRIDYLEGRLWQMGFTGYSGDAPPVDLLTAGANAYGDISGLDLTPEITNIGNQ